MTPTLPEGLKVWYEYGQTYTSPQGRSLRPYTLRRYVVAHVVDAETREQVVTGMAVCSPVDQFTKKIGRTKALGRALGELDKMGRLP